MTHEKVIEMINEYLEEPHSIDKEWVEALKVCRDAINDVVKAFKNCTSEHLGCEDDCPCMSVINRQKKEIDILIRKKDNLRDEISNLEYIIMGIMHSVDKWLDGDELKQDEVNRAVTMREKTLQITEKQQAEIERLKTAYETLKQEYDSMFSANRNLMAENEKLKIRLRKAEHQLDDLCKMHNIIKSEAYREFAERLVDDINKDISLYGNCTVHSMALKINNTLKELTEKNDKE